MIVRQGDYCPRARRLDRINLSRFRQSQVFALNSLVLIGSGCLIALMPLALYFLFLAFLNQRSRPTLLNGVWDFTFVLLGLSGFIIVGGPVLLAIVDSTWRSYWFGGNLGDVQKVWNASSGVSSGIACGYLGLLALLIGIGLYVRRSVTVIYNVDSSSLDPLLITSLEAKQLVWRRVLGGIEIGTRKRGTENSDSDLADAHPSARALSGKTALLRIDSFPSFHHTTLRWQHYDQILRLEVEAELDKQVQAIECPGNPVGSWFKTAALMMLFIMLAWMGFLIYMIVVRP